MSQGGGLRVLGGELRGRRLVVPPGARPSGARLRAALFSIWQERLWGAKFLDLFAGSGAVGIEAVSRGAGQVTFVETSKRSLAALRRNLETLDVQDCRVLQRRLPAPVPELRTFDLLFADPPYAFTDFEALLREARPWAAPGGELALEHSSRNPPAEVLSAWRRQRLRAYGESCLSFYRLE